MNELIRFAFWFGVGYLAVTKAAPAIQAKVEAMDLDSMWDVYAEEWSE